MLRFFLGPLLAAGTVLGMLALRQAFYIPFPGLPLFMCLIVALMAGGKTPGIITLGIGIIGELLYFSPPLAPIRITLEQGFRLGLFAITGALVIATIHWFQKKIQTLDTFKKDQQLLQEYERQMRDLFVQMPAIITITEGPDHIYKMANNAAKALFMPQDIVGKSIRQVFKDLQHGKDFFNDFDRAYAGEKVERNQLPLVRNWHNSEQPTTRWFNVLRQPLKNAQGEITGVITFSSDITSVVEERHESERELFLRAHTDALTQLPNRKAFEEDLARTLEKAAAERVKFAVLFMDIDRLKTINDTLGHTAGDIVLVESATRIRDELQAGECVFRWAGDEFVLLFPGISSTHAVSKRAERILKVFEPPMRVHEQMLHVTASIGIAIFPADGVDSRSLQKNADAALYRSKESGKNKFMLYNQSMNMGASQELELEHALRRAVGRGEFEIYYQPIFDLKQKNITSVEALLRWRHEVLGRIPPSRFIPLAEELGLIDEIGRFALDTVCNDISFLDNLGMGHLKFSLNISARQFNDEQLVAKFHSRLMEGNCSPSRFEMEITESVAMENSNRTRRQLEELQQLGFGVTIDDFGTGYSSLNYLKRFPIQKLKIDKGFVRHCLTDEQDTSIIKAIISMAKSLKLSVVAEGVDTEAQLNLLASLGCDAVQGYFISRPLARGELLAFTPRLPEAVKISQTQEA